MFFISSKKLFLEIFKFFDFHLCVSFSLLAIVSEIDPRKMFYDVINCLNKNLITHFIRYLEKEIRFYIEISSIHRELNKEHFY